MTGSVFHNIDSGKRRKRKEFNTFMSHFLKLTSTLFLLLKFTKSVHEALIFGLSSVFSLHYVHRSMESKTVMHLPSQHIAGVQSSVQLTWLSA